MMLTPTDALVAQHYAAMEAHEAAAAEVKGIGSLRAAYFAVKDSPTDTYSVREYAGFILALLGDDAIVACSSRQPWMSDDDWSFRQQAGKVIAAAMQEEAS